MSFNIANKKNSIKSIIFDYMDHILCIVQITIMIILFQDYMYMTTTFKFANTAYFDNGCKGQNYLVLHQTQNPLGTLNFFLGGGECRHISDDCMVPPNHLLIYMEITWAYQNIGNL